MLARLLPLALLLSAVGCSAIVPGPDVGTPEEAWADLLVLAVAPDTDPSVLGYRVYSRDGTPDTDDVAAALAEIRTVAERASTDGRFRYTVTDHESGSTPEGRLHLLHVRFDDVAGTTLRVRLLEAGRTLQYDGLEK